MASRYCTSCGAILNDSARFCPNCGAPVSTPGQPSGDDTQLSDDSTRLTDDHTRLSDDDTQLSSSPKPRTQPKPQPARQRSSNSTATRQKASNGSSNQILMWILGIAIAAAVGVGVAYLASGSSHNSSYDERIVPDEQVAAENTAEVEYAAAETEAPAEEAQAVEEEVWSPDVSTTLLDNDTWVSASSLYGDELKTTTNFTRPDLTINDAHGHILVLDLYNDGNLIDSHRFDRDGNIIGGAWSLTPSSLTRDDKGRIISGTYMGHQADYNWDRGLLSSIRSFSGSNINYNYDAKGQLSSVYTYDRNGNYVSDTHYDNYIYDDCKNWISRRCTDNSGNSGTQTRRIYYYRP